MAQNEKCGGGIDGVREKLQALTEAIHNQNNTEAIHNLMEDDSEDESNIEKLFRESGELLKDLIIFDREGQINYECILKISFYLQKISTDLLEISLNKGEIPENLAKNLSENISAVLAEILSDC